MAQDWCGQGYALSNAVAEAASVARSRLPIDAAQARQLSQSLDRFQPPRNASFDFRAHQDTLQREIAYVIGTGRFYDRPGFVRAAGLFKKAVDQSCKKSDTTNTSQNVRGPAEYAPLETGTEGGLGRTSLTLGGVDGLLAVFATTVFMAACLVLVHNFYLWLSTLMFNRRSCLLSADIIICEQKIRGQITMLSRSDCRFLPRDPIEMLRWMALAEAGPAELAVKDIRVPGYSRTLYDGDGTIAFDHPLDIAFYKEIITRSTLATHYVKTTLGLSNVKRKKGGAPRYAYRINDRPEPGQAALRTA